MRIHIPFANNHPTNGTRWTAADNNEKQTLNGVYPLVEKGALHTGIHLSNKGGMPQDNFLKAVTEGELVAYKLASDYDMMPLGTLDVQARGNDELREKLENARVHYPDIFQEAAAITERADATADILTSTIKSPATKKIEEPILVALSKILTPFSTGFVLTRHKLRLGNGGEITFFVLFSNLAPISDYTPDREVFRTFFRKWLLKGAAQLCAVEVGKLNLYSDAECTIVSGKVIEESGPITLYKGMAGVTCP